MKTILTIGFLTAVAALAQDQATTLPPAKKTVPAKKKATPKAAAKSTAPPAIQPLTIPAEATPNADGTYAYTDKSGKQWTYSKTPFGISKIQNNQTPGAAMTATPPSAATAVKATDHGDTVLFEKPSPFGTQKWEKKKSEMTDEERGIFQAQHPDKQQ